MISEMENIRSIVHKKSKLLILTTVLITSACNLIDLTPPDNGGLTTVVDGLVIDNYTHKGISDVPIIIEDEEANYFPPANTDTFYDTIITDSAGYYRYEFVNKIGRNYNIYPLSTSTYYNNDYFHHINEGEQVSYNFLYKPYRNLRMTITNKQKVWSRFDIYSVDQKLVIPWDFNTIIVDTILSMRIVPDVDIKFKVSKSSGQYGNADYKSESSFLNFNFRNKDTILNIDY